MLQDLTNLHFFVFAPKTHSVKLCFKIADNSLSEYEACQHRIIDVQGDTLVKWEIPYTSLQLTTIPEPPSGNFHLYVEIVSWAQADDNIAVPIYVVTYKAGGEDFKVAELLDQAFSLQSNEIELQSAPRDIFKDSFEPFCKGNTLFSTQNVLNGEEYTSVRDIIKRFAPIKVMGPSNVAQVFDYSPTVGETIPKYSGLEIWGWVFRFWRGGIHFRFIQGTPGLACITVDDNADFETDTKVMGVGVASAVRPQIDLTVPYNSYHPFQHTNRCNLSTTGPLSDEKQIKYSGQGNIFMFKAAADDFEFSWPILPPAYNLAYESSNIGTARFEIFCNNRA